MFESSKIEEKREEFRCQIRRKMIEKERKIFHSKVQQYNEAIVMNLQKSESEGKQTAKYGKQLEKISLSNLGDMNLYTTLQTLEKIYVQNQDDFLISQKITTILLRISMNEMGLFDEVFDKFLTFASRPAMNILWLRVSKFQVPQKKKYAAEYFFRHLSNEEALMNFSITVLIETVSNFVSVIPIIPEKYKFLYFLSYVVNQNPQENLQFLANLTQTLRSIISENAPQCLAYLVQNNYFNILDYLTVGYQNSTQNLRINVLSIFKTIFRESCPDDCEIIVREIGPIFFPILLKDLEEEDYRPSQLRIIEKILTIFKESLKIGDQSLKILIKHEGEQFLMNFYKRFSAASRPICELSGIILSISFNCSVQLVLNSFFLRSYLLVIEEMLIGCCQISITLFCLESLTSLMNRIESREEEQLLKENLKRSIIVSKVREIYQFSKHSEIIRKSQIFLNTYDQ